MAMILVLRNNHILHIPQSLSNDHKEAYQTRVQIKKNLELDETILIAKLSNIFTTTTDKEAHQTGVQINKNLELDETILIAKLLNIFRRLVYWQVMPEAKGWSKDCPKNEQSVGAEAKPRG